MQDKKENLNPPERRLPEAGRESELERESELNQETREIPTPEKLVSDELRREIEMMELDDNLKEEAKKKAEKISFLGEDKKIEHLLEIAKNKGVLYAIQVCKKMNDAYLLDIFHDVLAREGYYKEFLKK